MALNASWIDALFARMQLRYAQTFERNFAGMDIALVKADWANVLDGVSPKAIAYALVNLPLDWPPNAMQFHALCIRGAPERQAEPELLDAPLPDPARVAAELAKLREIQSAAKRGPKQWAFDLQARENSGERLSIAQRTMWRAAVASGVEPTEQESNEDANRTARLKADAARKVAEYVPGLS